MSLFVDGRVGSIHYCSLEHKKGNLLTLIYEDRGELRIDGTGLRFIGKRMEVDFKGIKGIDLVPNLSRELGGFIRVRYTDGGVERAADLFKLDDDVLMGKRKEDNTALFEELRDLLKR